MHLDFTAAPEHGFGQVCTVAVSLLEGLAEGGIVSDDLRVTGVIDATGQMAWTSLTVNSEHHTAVYDFRPPSDVDRAVGIVWGHLRSVERHPPRRPRLRLR